MNYQRMWEDLKKKIRYQIIESTPLSNDSLVHHHRVLVLNKVYKDMDSMEKIYADTFDCNF